MTYVIKLTTATETLSFKVSGDEATFTLRRDLVDLLPDTVRVTVENESGHLICFEECERCADYESCNGNCYDEDDYDDYDDDDDDDDDDDYDDDDDDDDDAEAERIDAEAMKDLKRMKDFIISLRHFSIK